MRSVRPCLSILLFLVALWGMIVLCDSSAMAHDETSSKTLWMEPTTGIQFQRVPSGCFEMGSPEEERFRKEDETQTHTCVEEMWLSVFEITRGQFEQFVQETKYKTTAEWEQRLRVWNPNGGWRTLINKDWRDPDYDQTDKHPVVGLSHEDAEAFAAWLSTKGNGTYRLPTAAEWEYAARAGSQTSHPWGTNPELSCSYANLSDMDLLESFLERRYNEEQLAYYRRVSMKPSGAVPCHDGYDHTAPVGKYRSNAFGLHDMIGNAQEWVAEPTNANLNDKVYPSRGGSFISPVTVSRSAAHMPVLTSLGVPFNMGIRLVREE